VGAVEKANAHYASCTIRPDGMFAYCPAGGPPSGGEFVVYSLDPTTGVATQASSIDFGVDPVLMSITPNGNFAYVMQPYGKASALYGFMIDSVSGALTPISGSPFSVLSVPTYIVAGINNTALYVNQLGAILTYSIDPSGALSLQSGGITTVGGITGGLALDPSGKFLYFVDGLGLKGASIDASTGALTLIPGSPFTSESNGQQDSFAIAPIIQ
jgi:DNA-binding beta-propeller fold protein YncE